jgi:hypothetical protein
MQNSYKAGKEQHEPSSPTITETERETTHTYLIHVGDGRLRRSTRRAKESENATTVAVPEVHGRNRGRAITPGSAALLAELVERLRHRVVEHEPNVPLLSTENSRPRQKKRTKKNRKGKQQTLSMPIPKAEVATMTGTRPLHDTTHV